MPANECIPLFRGGVVDLTGHTTAAVTGGTFVTLSGDAQAPVALNTSTGGGNYRVATAAAGAKAFGVAAHDAASGKKVPVIRQGNVVPMVADGAITANDEIEVGTAGKPKLKASGVTVGKATTTAANGAVVYVEIL
jgi:uncharacterized protein DUF2190